MQTETMRIIRASILGSVAILPILMLPTMVGALVDYAGFTEAEAGWVAAVGFAGSALGAITVGLRVRHLDPQKLAVLGLMAMAVFDAASMFVSQLPVWLFVTFRFLSGVGGAVAYAAVVTTIAATANPDRGYGIFMVFQFGLSAACLYGLPIALPSIGVFGMYLLMAVAAALSLVLKDSVIHRSTTTEDPAIEIHMLVKPAAILAMLGIGFYEMANFMHFTYADRIGVSFALSMLRIGEILGVASLLGIPAALIVVWIGDRFGELGPLVFAVLLSTGSLLWLLVSEDTAAYVVAMSVLGFAWAFGLPYFYAVEARLDPGGSVVVVGGFFTACGSVAGPALAAALVAPANYNNVLIAAIGIYLLVICLMTLSMRVAPRS
jgi:MFS family permease